MAVCSEKFTFADEKMEIDVFSTDKMNNTTTLSPQSFDVSKLPTDFGTGRFKDLLVTFDNIERDYPLAKQRAHFPIKCESLFIITVLRGNIRLNINLSEVVLSGGQMLVMMPGCIFDGQEVSEDVRFFGIMIDHEYMETMRKNVGLNIDLTHRYYTYFVNSVSQLVLDNHLQMYRMILQELSEGDYMYKKEVIQRYCEIWLLKNISQNGRKDYQRDMNKPLNRKEQIFHDFLALLEQYFSQERSISFYADRMCLTPKYLSTIIKDVSGKHGMQWIDEYVSLEAKALLRHSELSVKQVSDQLNFPSQSMFGRFFKKMTGYSPKQYKLL